MLKRIYGLCEAATLVLLGAGMLWFALSANYGLLMNTRFRWLTVAGAAFVLVLGLVALRGLREGSGLNTLIFGLLLLVTFVGKPYLPTADSAALLEPPMQTGLWDQVDQARFPRKKLQALYMVEADEVHGNDASFTVVGIAKRLEALDARGSFALMQSVMFCCVADAFAVGFRVPTDDLATIEDGQWFMVCGKLVQEETEIPLPNFRFGTAMVSSVHKSYYLQPDRVMSFSWMDQFPPLTEQLGGQASSLFRKALRESGLWRELEGKGPFTVFVPIDRAMEALGGASLDELSAAELKQFVSSHIVRGRLLSRDLMEREELVTLSGRVLKVELVNGQLRINQSRLLFKDTAARNGVIHYIYPAIAQDGGPGRQ